MTTKPYFTVLLKTVDDLVDRFIMPILFVCLSLYMMIPGIAFPIMILSMLYAFVSISTMITKKKSIIDYDIDNIMVTFLVLCHSTVVSILSVLYFLSKLPNSSIFAMSNIHSMPFLLYSTVSFIVVLIISLVVYGIIYVWQLYVENLVEYKNKQNEE